MKSLLIAAVLFMQGASRPPAAPPVRTSDPFKVAGRIQHQGNPVLLGAGIDIALTSESDETVLKAVIAPDGSFAFTRVAPGAYQLSIPDGPAILLGDRVTVADRDVTGVTLTVILTPASIHVNEAAVTRLNLRRDSGRGVSQQTETLGDGWFDISGMPGTYTVSPVSPSAVPLPSFNVTLPPLRAAELEAALPRLRSVTVRTTVEGGAAPPPFSLSIRGTIAAGRPERQARQGTVQALSPETPVSGVTVDIVPGRDGAARIFLPDGRYQFDAAPAAGSAARLRLKSIEGAGANLIHNALEVAGDEKEIKVLFE